MTGESQPNAYVNETSRYIQRTWSKFARAIIVGKRVMIVVKAFADCQPTDEVIFARIDVDVIGTHAPHMSGAVHEPRAVETEGIAQHAHGEIRVPRALSQKRDGKNGRQNEREKESELDVVSIL